MTVIETLASLCRHSVGAAPPRPPAGSTRARPPAPPPAWRPAGPHPAAAWPAWRPQALGLRLRLFGNEAGGAHERPARPALLQARGHRDGPLALSGQCAACPGTLARQGHSALRLVLLALGARPVRRPRVCRRGRAGVEIGGLPTARGPVRCTQRRGGLSGRSTAVLNARPRPGSRSQGLQGHRCEGPSRLR